MKSLIVQGLGAGLTLLGLMSSPISAKTAKTGSQDIVVRAKAFVSATKNKRIMNVSTPFRISAREVFGAAPVGEWWLSADESKRFNAEPSPGVSGFQFEGPNGRIDLTMRLETNWQLYFECDASMSEQMHWEAKTTSAGISSADATRDPTTGKWFFVTPAADGSLPDFLSTVTLTSVNSTMPVGLWTVASCEVLPIAL